MLAPLILFAAFAAGTVAGSFIALVADRWPRGENWVSGRSRCRSCGAVLPPWHMVPLLSYAVLRGRCADCGARLEPMLPIAEAAGGGIAVLALLAAPGGWAGALALAGFGWCLLLLALLDAGHFWLPNAITLPLALAGLASSRLLPAPPLVERLLGAALGWASFAALAALYRRLRGREGLGGGDARLMAAIGAWLGVQALPLVVLVGALLGLGWAGCARLGGAPITATTRIPLGTALAVAALAVMPLVL